MNDTLRNWTAIAGICLVFVFGIITGVALTIQVERARTEKLFASGRLGDALVERMTHRLTTKLDCDDHQREEIRVIMLDAQRDMLAARRQIAPQLRQVFFQTAGRVRGILRGDQVKTFDEIMARIRARQNPAATEPAAVPATAPDLPVHSTPPR